MGARLACVLWVAAGCGRLGFDDVAPIIHEGALPASCEQFTWPGIAPVDRDVELSVAVTTSGIAVGWVPHADGPLFGAKFALDGSMLTDPTGTMIKTGGWVGGSVMYIDDTLVASESENNLTSVKYDTLDAALAIVDNEFGCPTARLLAKPPLVHAGADLVGPTLYDDGLSIWQITNWGITTAATVTEPSTNATGIASVEIGNLAAVVWSANEGCHRLVMHDAMTAAHDLASSSRCNAPRMAAAGAQVSLVYETAAGATLAHFDPTVAAALQGAVFGTGASPRIVNDGVHEWATYLDATGIVVGYFDAAGTHRSTHLPITPAHDAYELAIIDAEPWIVALDAGGLSATRICVP